MKVSCGQAVGILGENGGTGAEKSCAWAGLRMGGAAEGGPARFLHLRGPFSALLPGKGAATHPPKRGGRPPYSPCAPPVQTESDSALAPGHGALDRPRHRKGDQEARNDRARDRPRADDPGDQQDHEEHTRKRGADEEMEEEEKGGHGGCPSRWGGGGL